MFGASTNQVEIIRQLERALVVREIGIFIGNGVIIYTYADLSLFPLHLSPAHDLSFTKYMPVIEPISHISWKQLSESMQRVKPRSNSNFQYH